MPTADVRSNPVAIMVVRHRAVTHDRRWRSARVAWMRILNPQVAGRGLDRSAAGSALTPATG
ncbi:hypothetical protein ACLK19_02840 [Escherichia coli]